MLFSAKSLSLAGAGSGALSDPGCLEGARVVAGGRFFAFAFEYFSAFVLVRFALFALDFFLALALETFLAFLGDPLFGGR